MFGRNRKLEAPHANVSPVLGGIVGSVLTSMVTRRIAGRLATGGGGLPGIVIGLAATYALNRYLERRNGRTTPAPR